MERVGYAGATFRMTFPYVPGLLSFREIPVLLEAWKLLPVKPEVLLVDGHGIMHPRRMGIATHLGLLTGLPAVGCGKSRLLGTYEMPGECRGSYSPLYDKDDLLGHVLRTKNRVKPLFISPGHLIDFEGARHLALHYARGYRLSEPTRQAHLIVNALRREEIPLGWQAG
jgi:deoxyribonuclease V